MSATLSLSKLASARLTPNCRSSTPNISSVSPLTCVPPPPPHLAPDCEGFALSDRNYLKKRGFGCGGCVDGGGEGGVVPACLWQSDRLRVVADRRPWWVVVLFFFRWGSVSFFFSFFFSNTSRADSCVLSPGTIRTENEIRWKVSVLAFQHFRITSVDFL